MTTDAEKGQSLRELEACIGQRRESGTWLRVTQHMIDAFADATFDHQYIHVDPERARSSPFGCTVAHGFLTLSLLPHLLESIELVPARVIMGVNYGLNRVRFPNAVKVDAELRASATLLAVAEPTPGRILLTQEVTVHIRGEAKPAMIAESLALWLTRTPTERDKGGGAEASG